MKKISWLAIAAFLLAVAVFWYVNRAPASVATKAADFELALSNIFDDLESNPDTTLKMLVDKIIVIEGHYNSQSGDSNPVIIIQDDQGRLANCSLNEPHEGTYEKGQKIKIKGVFVGFDELFGEIQLNQCHIQ